MGKYFGTDGFRGEANVDLTAHHAYRIGLYLGHQAQEGYEFKDETDRPSIVIGKDTRHSGDMLEMALAAGITASGTDAYLLGVVTTPGVAFLTRKGAFKFGVMISASHNPFYDNGIKVLNEDGEKLPDSVVAGIEEYLDECAAAVNGEAGLSVADEWLAKRDRIGRVAPHEGAIKDYMAHLLLVPTLPFDGYRIALDCSNGSAYTIAAWVFKQMGAQVSVTNAYPTGFNINENCGSTHIEALAHYVADNNLDLGFAYDGDADRCLAVDAAGNVVSGDQIIYACAVYLKSQGRLANNTAVTTIMSNFGLYKAFDEAGIAYEKTKVGDKYVYENMAANGHSIGGEQSGHIIFSEYATTGDGILTSLMVMEVIANTGKTLAELVAPMTVYPQVLKNVRVKDKAETLANEAVQAAIQAAGEALGDTGRVLVRESGTEPVIRVMAEAPTQEECEKHVDAIVEAITSQGL